MSIDQVRSIVAAAVRERVRGLEGDRTIAELRAQADEPRWFGPDRPIVAVHADTALFVGALRALLLQSLHPLAMAGVAQHSDYRADPWGRLQRTASFLARTTFGTAEQAEAACRRVRQVHERVVGVAADGRPYEANDPHLLAWVHACEVDSFLAAYQSYGRRRLTPYEQDAYVADLARIATVLGAEDPPTTVAELRATLQRFRPELKRSREAVEAARFLLLWPPLPLPARPFYGVIASAAVGLLPWWARFELRLPVTPVADRVAVRPASRAVLSLLRWSLADDAAEVSMPRAPHQPQVSHQSQASHGSPGRQDRTSRQPGTAESSQSAAG